MANDKRPAGDSQSQPLDQTSGATAKSSSGDTRRSGSKSTATTTKSGDTR
jgi:hypothetical protein